MNGQPKNNRVPGWKVMLGLGAAAVSAGAVGNEVVKGVAEADRINAIHAVQPSREGLRATGKLLNIGEPQAEIQKYDDESGVERERTIQVVYFSIAVNGEQVQGRLLAEDFQNREFHPQQTVNVRYSEFPDQDNPGKVRISINGISNLDD